MGILKQDNGKTQFFAGTSIGLFSTDSLVLGTNSGTNTTVWSQESPTLIGSNVVTDLKIRQSDGYVVIGTHGGGVFDSYYTNKYPAAVQTYTQPSVFIYPNPAKDNIIIKSKDQILSADLIDAIGKSKKLNNQNGTYLLDDLTDGIYTLRIIFEDGKTVTEKIIIGK